MSKPVKQVFIVNEKDEGEDTYPLVFPSVAEAWENCDGDEVTVEVYKLVRTVKVTRSEFYNEEAI